VGEREDWKTPQVKTIGKMEKNCKKRLKKKKKAKLYNQAFIFKIKKSH